MLQVTCKIIAISSLDWFIQNVSILYPKGQSGIDRWCWNAKIYRMYDSIFGSTFIQASANLCIYGDFIMDSYSNDVSVSCCRAETLKQANQQYIIDWGMFAVQFFENGIHTKTLIVAVNKQGEYVISDNKNDIVYEWDGSIPEEYKPQLTHENFFKMLKLPMTYEHVRHTSIYIDNDNLSIEDDMICVDGKKCTMTGYYINDEDMFTVNGNNLEIHVPFGCINFNDQSVMERINKYALDSYTLINDNTKMKDVCKMVIIDHNNKIDENKITNAEDIKFIKDKSLFIRAYAKLCQFGFINFKL